MPSDSRVLRLSDMILRRRGRPAQRLVHALISVALRLVFAALPRRISFLAKSTLFPLPVIGWLLRTVEALPLYRRADAGEDVSRNLRTFEACRRLLLRGRRVALFPEGLSHNEPKLQPVKTGAARIALSSSVPGLKIVPVGLYYT